MLLRNSVLASICGYLSLAGGYTTSLGLDDSVSNHQKCVDIHGTNTFRPENQASLIVNFPGAGEGVVSLVMFELGDEHLGGVRPRGPKEKEILCTEENVARGLCSESQIGEFLISDLAREKAHYPFVTRAVNLSTPASIHYPISGPGLYCTATFGFSAASFSATMLAIDPSSENLPAFRAGSLKIYRYLGPLWTLLVTLWMLHLFDVSERPCWVVPLSAVQVGLRWAQLEAGEQSGGIALALKITSNLTEIIQDFSVILHSYLLMTEENAKPTTKPWVSYIGLFVLGVGVIAMKWAKMTSTATDQAVAYSNMALASLLLIHIMRLAWLSRRRGLTGQDLPFAISTALAFLLAVICILSAATATFSIWCLLQLLTPLEFGQRFWRTRFLTMDLPFDIISLCGVCYLSLYWQCKRRPPYIREDHVEMGKLRASVDSVSTDDCKA